MKIPKVPFQASLLTFIFFVLPESQIFSLNQTLRHEHPYLFFSVKYSLTDLLINSSTVPSEELKEDSVRLQQLDRSTSRCGPFQVDIKELTIEKAQFYFRANILSSLELTKCYLKRIELMDPVLKSVIEVNPEALKYAETADAERSSAILQNYSGTFSLLHGIPLLIKDNIGTADKMQTTVGSKAMEFLIPKADAEVVQRLRKAGAVILGKTNPSEWAGFRNTDGRSGWSGRGGQTRSPYVLSEDPSGSSSGSGAAISANLALASLGTETDGSIISPSAKGSLVGIKPSVNSVSTRGVIPLSFAQDVVGPMTRSVKDAAILMRVLTDAKYSFDNCFYSDKKCQIGAPEELWDAEKGTEKEGLNKKILQGIQQLGFDLNTKLRTNFSHLSPFVTYGNERTILLFELKYGLNKYLKHDVNHLEGQLGRKILTLKDIIQFNREDQATSNVSQINLVEAEDTDGLENKTYKTLRRGLRKGAERFLQTMMGKDELDLIVAPCTDSVDTPVPVSLHSVAAMAGFPSVTIPISINEKGIPVGLCFVGKRNDDFLLLEVAYKVEKLMHSMTPRLGRSLPKFRP